MSELLRETVDYLRAQLSKIDLRLTEMDAEGARLAAARTMIRAVLDGEAESKSGVGHAQLTGAPAGGATSPASTRATSARRRLLREHDVKPAEQPHRSGHNAIKAKDQQDAEAAERVLGVLHTVDGIGPVKAALVMQAANLPGARSKRLLARLVTLGTIVRTGHARGSRYSLPAGRAKRSAPNGNGKGSPADDDAHGAVRVMTSAGDAGVTPAPGEATSLQPPVLRPPASTEVTTMDVLDDDEPRDALAADADRDGFGDVFDEPPYRAPIRRPDLRQPRTGPAAAAKTTTARESFWLRPDADWQAEADRMRNDPKAMNVPGQNNILCAERARDGGGAW